MEQKTKFADPLIFAAGEEYAWIEYISSNMPKVNFIQVDRIDRHYEDKLQMVSFLGHPYYFENEYYHIKAIISDLRWYNVTLIKVENEQQKFALRIKYE